MAQFDFRKMSFYQIWVRSFCDGNGDGIGDLYGVYDKLDYIKSLGVDGIWFNPLYPSPNADFGYDISDYKDIHPDYGSLDQFRRVLDKAHALGLKVIMDLVINHTSTQHPWFLESRKSRDNPYSDYYIWRSPRHSRKGRLPPNNWFSQLEGMAWEYCEEREQYYLHLFSKNQPDLNMDNPKVREEVKGIMRYWLDMGVDGFREDVITFISKHEGLPDGLAHLPIINGLPYYMDGPNLLRYLSEFREVAKEYGALQIGEAPLTTLVSALGYISGKDRVLDMIIQFDHMAADCFATEYLHHQFSLPKLKRAFSLWQYALSGRAWNALYLENHDHPRVLSRYGSKRFWRESGTALAACYLFQQGTPFIFQGQELGMTNIRLRSIDHYLDVSSKNAYNSFLRWAPEKSRLRRIHYSSRDSARTPVQWTGGRWAGFSSVRPWFYLNHNYRTVNAESEERDPDSILNFYRRCLALRKSSETLLWGNYREHFPASRKLYCYERRWKGERILVLCSFWEEPISFTLPLDFPPENAELLLCNYPGPGQTGRLRPYEARILRWQATI